MKAESPLESKSMLPLISVWEREELHPCSAGSVCTGHAWKALSSCQDSGWRGREEGFDKVLSAGTQGGGSCPSPLETLTDIQCSVSSRHTRMFPVSFYGKKG